MTTYTYTCADEVGAKLLEEINADTGIGPACTSVTWRGPGADETILLFEADLETAEKTTLDALVAAHDPTPHDPVLVATEDVTLQPWHRFVVIAVAGITITLMPASSLASRQEEIVFTDESEDIGQSVAKRVRIVPQGSDSLCCVTAPDAYRLTTKFSGLRLYSDGVSKFFLSGRH